MSRGTLAAIVAGGKSTRMGRDKSSIEIDGRTFLERVHEVVSEVTDRVVVVGGQSQGDFECWPDSVHASGPLAGLATALARSEEERVLLVAVDHPFVRVETLRKMIDVGSQLPIVPVDDDGIRQVTCAVYPKTVAGAAGDEARAGGSIQTLLDLVSFDPVTPDIWAMWGEDGRSWFSVDTPGDLEDGLARFG